jgi:exopolyphosphatase/guanosine-5'-triphosphate,3'-diphosphate pyrophosphatase
MFGLSSRFTKPPEALAAVDLGSNSFHMKVARVVDGQLHVIDRLREMVRLGAGLGKDKRLSGESQDRALACLERFGQRLRSMPPGSVRVAGTNTLRQARNAGAFLHAGEQVLGHPIEIISGVEEARLIYLGASQSIATNGERRLVVDIGGGSTELVVGEGLNLHQRESLHMGCVSASRAHFGEGTIRPKQMDKAEMAARLELRPVQATFKNAGWQSVVGCSGTIRAVRDVVCAAGWSENGITLSSLQKLRKALLKVGDVDKLDLDGLKEERKSDFAGGVAVLLGVFRALGLEHMGISGGAMREGLLYDLLGRIQHDDARPRTIEALVKRFIVDTDQSDRVRATACCYLRDVRESWDLCDPQYEDMLGWAARLHEIGLSISHAQYHKHGAYFVENADLSGFSYQEQAILAALVRGHRRRFPQAAFSALPKISETPARRLCSLLRLAVLLHRDRQAAAELPAVRLEPGQSGLDIVFPADWLNDNPLTRADLEREAEYLESAGFTLNFI